MLPIHRLFLSLKPDCFSGNTRIYLDINLRDIILKELPNGQKYTGDRNIKLRDVRDGKAKMSDFVAQLSPDELELITRGEGPMNSSLGAKGNAGAIGGVSESLREKGIPPIITTDGPSGIRLLSSCSLMPCGTALACTWDTELIKSLFDEMGEVYDSEQIEDNYTVKLRDRHTGRFKKDPWSNYRHPPKLPYREVQNEIARD